MFWPAAGPHSLRGLGARRLKNEETVLAESMIRTHGNNAVMRASDNVCIHAGMGDEAGAALWRRVMAVIGNLSNKSGASGAGAVRH